MTRIQRYLIGRLLIVSCIAALGICGPFSTLSVFREIPTALIYSSAIWSILYGILPNIFYLSLPVIVAVAATWQYETMVSNREIVALYAGRYSPIEIIMPAMAVAAMASVLGLFFSCVVAPHGTKTLWDVIHAYRQNPHSSSLEAKKFYHLKDVRKTIFFDQWLDANRISGVFLSEISEQHEETVVIAAEGEFVENEQESILFLRDVTVQVSKPGMRQPTIVSLDGLWRSTGLRGSAPPRRTIQVYEFGPVAFLMAFGGVKNDRAKAVRWASEALKRFGTPILTIIYTLIGLGLIIRGASMRADDGWRLQSTFGLIGINHAAIMLAVEGAVNIDTGIAWIIVFVMVAEMIIGVGLIGRLMWKGAALPFLQSQSTVRWAQSEAQRLP